MNKLNKLEKVLNNIEGDFVLFGIKKSTDANNFSILRKQTRFFVRKKTLIQKAFKEKNIHFNLSDITKKEQQNLCILDQNVLENYGKFLQEKKNKNKLTIHLICLLNNFFHKKNELENFKTTSFLFAQTKTEDRKRFILQNINNIFSSSMRNFLLLLKEIEKTKKNKK